MPTKETYECDGYEIIVGDAPPHLFAIDTADASGPWFIAFSHVALGEHGIDFYADVGVGGLLHTGGLSEGVDEIPDALRDALEEFPQHDPRPLLERDRE